MENALIESPVSTVAQQANDDAPSTAFTDAVIADLNARYTPLDFEARLRLFYNEFEADKVLVTSSFAATSAYFLHIIHRIEKRQKIAFIDTGYHFLETIVYRDRLAKEYGLEVFDIKAEEWKHQFTLDDQTWEKNPDFCCSINKVEPLEAIKPDFDVWVSSLMGWQTDHRAGMEVFEMRRGMLKFNPMIDVTRAQRDAYIVDHGLSFHPMVSQGYSSIGCTHCTAKGEGRSGRWAGKPKTECGLHL